MQLTLRRPDARAAGILSMLISQMGVFLILFFSLIFIYFSCFDTHFHGRKTLSSAADTLADDATIDDINTLSYLHCC
jgi:hypothetical protein